MSLWLRKLDPAETSNDEQLDQVLSAVLTFKGHMAEHTRRNDCQFIWDLLLANIQRVCQKMDLVNQENHHEDLADMASVLLADDWLAVDRPCPTLQLLASCRLCLSFQVYNNDMNDSLTIGQGRGIRVVVVHLEAET